MLLLITSIYIISLGLAVLLVSVDSFDANESPFVTALDKHQFPFFPHVFNGALIIAGFSTMVASLFAVTSMLVTLAKDGDAPAFFSKEGKGKVNLHLPALGLTVIGMIVSIIFSLLLPEKIFEYITTAAGLMLIYNWFFILFYSNRLLKMKGFDHIKRFGSMAFVLLAVSGTLLEKASRIGFIVSLAFVVVVGLVVLKMRKKWQQQSQES